jgi:flagellar biosynthesis protein FlhA
VRAEAARPPAPPAEAPAAEPVPADFLLVDPLELEVGFALIALVDPHQGGDLLERVKTIRQQLATELGVLIPPVRIRDNVALGANAYVVKLRGNPVGEGEVLPGYSLALLPDGYDGPVPGVRTTDPTFGLPAAWVPERSLPEAERLGFTVIEAPAVVTTHLLEVLRKSAHQLLDRQEVRGLLDKVKETAPALIDDLTAALSLGDVQKVLKRLLRERIPIRDLVTILEALADHAGQTKNLDVLTEYVRASLAATITRQFTADDGRVHLVVLDPPLEQHLLELAETGRLNPNTLGLTPERAQRFIAEAERLAQALLMQGWPPVLLTSPVLRGTLSAFLAGQAADLAVLSYHDLTPAAALDVADQLTLP